jgi:hypothetical protein
MCISGIGFGLAAVSVAGSVYGEARYVEDPLVSLPQSSASKKSAAPPRQADLLPRGLLLLKRESIIDEL